MDSPDICKLCGGDFGDMVATNVAIDREARPGQVMKTRRLSAVAARVCEGCGFIHLGLVE